MTGYTTEQLSKFSLACFTVRQPELKNVLTLLQKNIDPRPAHPILSNILFSEKDGEVFLTAFDLSTGIKLKLEIEKLTGLSAVTVPSRLFYQIVSKLPKEELITIEINNYEETEQITINISTENSNYTICGTSADEYPAFPALEDEKQLLLNSETINQLKKILFSAAKDETKPALSGVFIEFEEDQITTATTDGHRLSEMVLEVESESESESESIIEDTSLLLASKDINLLTVFLESVCPEPTDVSIKFDESTIMFFAGKHTFLSRRLVYDYPKYKQLVPSEFKFTVSIDKSAFLSLLERVTLLCDDKHSGINLVFQQEEDVIEVKTSETEIGSAKEYLECQDIPDGLNQFSIWLNHKYLLDFLKSITSSNLILKLNLPLTPIIFWVEQEHLTYLIMPIQGKE